MALAGTTRSRGKRREMEDRGCGKALHLRPVGGAGLCPSRSDTSMHRSATLAASHTIAAPGHEGRDRRPAVVNGRIGPQCARLAMGGQLMRRERCDACTNVSQSSDR
jgi:hypothetical protein